MTRTFSANAPRRSKKRAGRAAEAATSYARALDLEPESEPTFRSLLRLRQATGTLDALFRQVRRPQWPFPIRACFLTGRSSCCTGWGGWTRRPAVAQRLRERRP